jgi:hypothetical protein
VQAYDIFVKANLPALCREFSLYHTEEGFAFDQPERICSPFQWLFGNCLEARNYDLSNIAGIRFDLRDRSWKYYEGLDKVRQAVTPILEGKDPYLRGELTSSGKSSLYRNLNFLQESIDLSLQSKKVRFQGWEDLLRATGVESRAQQRLDALRQQAGRDSSAGYTAQTQQSKHAAAEEDLSAARTGSSVVNTDSHTGWDSSISDDWGSSTPCDEKPIDYTLISERNLAEESAGFVASSFSSDALRLEPEGGVSEEPPHEQPKDYTLIPERNLAEVSVCFAASASSSDALSFEPEEGVSEESPQEQPKDYTLIPARNLGGVSVRFVASSSSSDALSLEPEGGVSEESPLVRELWNVDQLGDLNALLRLCSDGNTLETVSVQYQGTVYQIGTKGIAYLGDMIQKTSVDSERPSAESIPWEFMALLD